MSDPAKTLEELDDYVHGVLEEEHVARFEEELFLQLEAGDNPALSFADELAARLSWLVSHQHFGESRTRREVEALRASNPHVHYQFLAAGQRTELAGWSEDTELVVIHLGVDLRGYEHAEMHAQRPDGTPIITFRDVRCDPEDGNVYAVCFEPLARLAFASGPVQGKLTGLRNGRRELIAELETTPLPTHQRA